jgi:hypothetical protein
MTNSIVTRPNPTPQHRTRLPAPPRAVVREGREQFEKPNLGRFGDFSFSSGYLEHTSAAVTFCELFLIIDPDRTPVSYRHAPGHEDHKMILATMASELPIVP